MLNLFKLLEVAQMRAAGQSTHEYVPSFGGAALMGLYSLDGLGPFGRKGPNQCLDRLAGLPGSSDAAVARDERRKVDFRCDADAGVPSSVASGVPEAAASISRARAARPTGRADQPSGTVSYGECGITRCQTGYPAHYPSPGTRGGGCDRVQFGKRIRLEQRGLTMRIGRISPQMHRDKICPIGNRHVCQARRTVEQWEFRGGAARVKRFAKDRGVAPGLIGFIGRARRPESARADAQWLKQSCAHQVFPRTTGELFQHGPRENVADIGIPVFGVRRDSWLARDA